MAGRKVPCVTPSIDEHDSLSRRERLNDELQRFPLATYRSTSESDADRTHLAAMFLDAGDGRCVNKINEAQASQRPRMDLRPPQLDHRP